MSCYTDGEGLDHSLLNAERLTSTRQQPSLTTTVPVAAEKNKSRRTIQRVASQVLTQLKAERAIDPGRPSLAAAVEYMRFFLPKTPDGRLLSLRCSEAEFTAHVGSGVSLYFHFVKMTGWLFVAASIVALPQFVANARGAGLGLQWPWSADCPPTAGGVIGFVQELLSTLGFFFFSALLGNVSFSDTHGTWHLASELCLSTMFSVYVYWIWWYNNKVLAQMETKVRASDSSAPPPPPLPLWPRWSLP